MANVEELHKANCLVCTPDCKPNAGAFVQGLYDIYAPDTRPKLLRAMRRNAAPVKPPDESEAD